MNDIADMVKALGSNNKPGSSVHPGVAYQNIPGLDIPCHRERTHIRANRIAELVDVRGKSVLDLGCNVGTISAQLVRHNARVVGVDYDEASIALARKVNVGPSYEVATIDLDYIQRLPHFDVIVWVSQFMWLVHQKGIDHALECLWEIGRHCDTLVFETAGRNDGMAPIDFSQEEIFVLLCKNTIFRSIRNCGQWNDLWTQRDVFVLSKPLIKHEGFFATVETRQRGTIEKTFKGHEYAKEIKKRCADTARILAKYPHFSRLISETDNSILMTWEGPQATYVPYIQGLNLLMSLDKEGLIHRDIRPDNLVFNGTHIVLTDFTFACFKGEVTNVSYDLGGKFKCPHGFNDQYSLMKCQQELLK